MTCEVFWFPTVFPQGFQPETNHYSYRVGPQKGKALAQEILFKVQVAVTCEVVHMAWPLLFFGIDVI